MFTPETTSNKPGSFVASVLSDETFHPPAPRTLQETGLSESVLEGLVLKYLNVVGISPGRTIAAHICLPFGVLENLLQQLRARQLVVHTGSAPLNDYTYVLTEHGRTQAQALSRSCSYVGPAPVPYLDYVVSVEAQTIRAEAPKRQQLLDAFRGICADTQLLDSLGPAINSGAGMFLYGPPGNGKSTLARRITRCFGQEIWVPHVAIEDGQLIKVFDAACHHAVENQSQTLLKETDFDHRWIKIRRPTVVVGGELTLDNLELRHDPRSNVCEGPLQMKSNCGCFLIDDFGRQQIEPAKLLNRWIIPLENRHDFLTLPTGKKIQVPFEQLIIFSTNLDPSQLTDEAFLRRIPYKIEVADPSESEFHRLFDLYARAFHCEYRREAVDYLLRTHYRPRGWPLRRCQPRDLLSQIRNYCAYNDLPIEMRPEYFDRVVRSYFTVVATKPMGLPPAAPSAGPQPVRRPPAARSAGDVRPVAPAAPAPVPPLAPRST